MRKLIIFEKQENSIRIAIKDRSNEKDLQEVRHNFYITYDELKKVLEGPQNYEYLHVKDIYSYCQVSKNTDKNNLCLDFTWVQSYCGKNLFRGSAEEIVIDLDKFVAWLKGPEKTLKTINKIIDFKTTITVKKPLISILQNKYIKNKFRKFLRDMQATRIGQYILYPDSMEYSFAFVQYINGEKWLNGGLIYHKNYYENKNPYKNNAPVGEYRMHT